MDSLTPIDMPLRGSILAALNPRWAIRYIMWLGEGIAAMFSATYKEHRQAVKKYRQEKTMALPFWVMPYLKSTGEKDGN